MSEADDARALIRHLQLKADAQQRNLDNTLSELELAKRKLNELNRKDQSHEHRSRSDAPN